MPAAAPFRASPRRRRSGSPDRPAHPRTETLADLSRRTVPVNGKKCGRKRVAAALLMTGGMSRFRLRRDRRVVRAGQPWSARRRREPFHWVNTGRCVASMCRRGRPGPATTTAAGSRFSSMARTCTGEVWVRADCDEVGRGYRVSAARVRGDRSGCSSRRVEHPVPPPPLATSPHGP